MSINSFIFNSTMLIVQMYPQSGTNGIVIIVDVVAIVIVRAIVVDVRCVVLIIAGRAKPPPAEPIQPNPRIRPAKAVISFCRWSSTLRADSGSPSPVSRSVHTASGVYTVAPLRATKNKQEASYPSLLFAENPGVLPGIFRHPR